MIKGSCLCGAVTYTARGTIGAPAACHCTQCRKQSGHVWASSYVEDGTLEITGDVRWFQSSEKAKRGFCPTCGSALFWSHDDDDFICFSTGSIDGPTGLRLRGHIHTAAKGDYYSIAADEPQRET
ncbi:GFA family protein [Roseobacter sinensis]|uniref:GFA family protein n=1 Tax=Roseobacter sinensis TaxID=2931391 RepID=A0ABT3B9H4_9RHOB|nr:GFA family protein [Roseobacter sp. WL0113]MCV3270229.1 GFA family protein [Roseobacter sp. WL0113]